METIMGDLVGAHGEKIAFLEGDKIISGTLHGAEYAEHTVQLSLDIGECLRITTHNFDQRVYILEEPKEKQYDLSYIDRTVNKPYNIPASEYRLASELGSDFYDILEKNLKGHPIRVLHRASSGSIIMSWAGNGTQIATSNAQLFTSEAGKVFFYYTSVGNTSNLHSSPKGKILETDNFFPLEDSHKVWIGKEIVPFDF